MRSIFLPLLTSILFTTSWVNAVLLEVEHKNCKYLLCSFDHEFTREEAQQSPIELRVIYRANDPRHPEFNSMASIRNNLWRPIRVGTGFPSESSVGTLNRQRENNFLFRSPAKALGPAYKFKDGLEGHYVIISLDETANVDYNTWKYLTKTYLMDQVKE